MTNTKAKKSVNATAPTKAILEKQPPSAGSEGLVKKESDPMDVKQETSAELEGNFGSITEKQEWWSNEAEKPKQNITTQVIGDC